MFKLSVLKREKYECMHFMPLSIHVRTCLIQAVSFSREVTRLALHAIQPLDGTELSGDATDATKLKYRFDKSEFKCMPMSKFRNRGAFRETGTHTDKFSFLEIIWAYHLSTNKWRVPF